MEATFAKIEDELKEININGEELKRTDLELVEVQEILIHAQTFFRQVGCSGLVVGKNPLFQENANFHTNLRFPFLGSANDRLVSLCSETMASS